MVTFSRAEANWYLRSHRERTAAAEARAKQEQAPAKITHRDPVDAVRLRGLPVVGCGIGGASPGTVPHIEGARRADRG